VSFSEPDRLDPAMIPVTAGKNKPSKLLQIIQDHLEFTEKENRTQK